MNAFLLGDNQQMAIVDIGILTVGGVVLKLGIAPAARSEVVCPVLQVNGFAVKFIRPHQSFAGIVVGRDIAFIVHANQGVVVFDGANGFLDTAGQKGSAGSGNDHPKCLVIFGNLVDYNFNGNGGRRCPAGNDQRILNGNKVQPLLGCE